MLSPDIFGYHTMTGVVTAVMLLLCARQCVMSQAVGGGTSATTAVVTDDVNIIACFYTWYVSSEQAVD